jgi:hypothetical protein
VGEVSDEIEDVIGARFAADVAGVVGIIGCEEDQGSRAGMLLVTVDGDFKVTILDEEHLFPGMAVGRVRFHAGIEGGYVDFELVHGNGGVVEDRTCLASSGGPGSERVPVDEGCGEDGGFFGRRIVTDCNGLRRSVHGDRQKQAKKQRFHAGTIAGLEVMLVTDGLSGGE